MTYQSRSIFCLAFANKGSLWCLCFWTLTIASPRSWWDTWKDYSGFTLDPDNAPTIRQRRADEMLPARPSEIDNSGLVVNEINKDAKNLKPNLVEGRDYILLYESTWKMLHSWYGGETAFMRQWVGGTNDSAFVEVYMLQLIIRRSSDNKEAQLFITREVQHRNPHSTFPASQPVCGVVCFACKQDHSCLYAFCLGKKGRVSERAISHDSAGQQG